jgi:hypothetical protein
MKKEIVIVVCFALVTLLASCATTSYDSSSFGNLKKGMSIEELTYYTTPKSRFQIALPSESPAKIDILVYEFRGQEYKSGFCNGDYFFVFKNNQLFHWGHPHEFARSYDSYINELGKAAVAEYLKIM